MHGGSTRPRRGTAGSEQHLHWALIEEIGVHAIHDHDLRLANRFRAGIGLAAADSALVFVDAPGARERLERAGIRAAVRNGMLRTSWHVYNTEEDVDRALSALSA